MLYMPREEGQGLVEYALILVLVAVVVIVVLAVLFVVITDLRFWGVEGTQGLAIARTARARQPSGRVFVLTAYNTPEVRVGFMRDNTALKRDKVRQFRDEIAAVAVDALGAEDVHGVLMPSRFSSDHSVTDAQALAERLATVLVGNPETEGVSMGPLVSLAQREEVRSCVAAIATEAEVVFGESGALQIAGSATRISAEDALRAVTIDAAYQQHLDHELGSIECGKRADFAVMAESPLDVDPIDGIDDRGRA